MKFSILPALIIAQFAIILLFAHKARKQNSINNQGTAYIITGLALLSLWAVIVTWLAQAGTFETEAFLSSWPALWIPAITIMIVEIPIVFSRKVRETIKSIIDSTPLHWLVAFHGLRILAIGSVLKAHNGEFAWYFGMLVGIPDMIFGISALILLPLIYQNRISAKSVAIWNYIGGIIVGPLAVILMQLGLPGPIQQFTATPTIATIFEFPMILAPAVIVPIFAMSNMFVARRILEHYRSGTTTQTAETTQTI